jgi:hypothetical protein
MVKGFHTMKREGIVNPPFLLKEECPIDHFIKSIQLSDNFQTAHIGQ